MSVQSVYWIHTATKGQHVYRVRQKPRYSASLLLRIECKVTSATPCLLFDARKSNMWTFLEENWRKSIARQRFV